MIAQLLQRRRPVLVDPEHRGRPAGGGSRVCGGAAMARVCILRGDGARLYFARARRWRNAPALFRAPRGERAAALLESSLSAEAICARLEALELTRSSCDLNSQSETPTGLSWLSLDAQISNYEPRRLRGCAWLVAVYAS